MVRCVHCVTLLLALAGCSESGIPMQTHADANKYSSRAGTEAIVACTRLLHSAGVLMSAARAHYHRGINFEEMSEWEHARSRLQGSYRARSKLQYGQRSAR